MRILLIRHGQSRGNVDEAAYITEGDHKVGLCDLGWKQAIAAGGFLKSYFPKTDTVDWPTLYLSSYQRTQETLRGILHGIDGAIEGSPKIYEDPRLIEKFFGATNHINNPEGIVDPHFASEMTKLSKAVYAKDPFTARNLFGDSSKDALTTMKGFIDGTLSRDVSEGKHDFMFVMHGATIQAFLMSWAHLPMLAKSKLKNPGNLDIISIEGTPKNWKIRKIYDGQRMQPVNEAVVDHIKLLTVDTLPPIPEAFQ